MGTSQLALYNGALIALGERSLVSLTDNAEARFYLDQVWEDGAVNYALQQGFWKFATRTGMIVYDPSIVPPFGYAYGFQQPPDYVKLSAISFDDYFIIPLTQYDDNGGFWFADNTQIFVRYISNDSAYGNNMQLWPPTFTEWFKLYLAMKISPRIAVADDVLDRVEKKEVILLRDAKNKDAAEQGTNFLPPGRWVMSRTAGNYRRRYDRAMLW